MEYAICQGNVLHLTFVVLGTAVLDATVLDVSFNCPAGLDTVPMTDVVDAVITEAVVVIGPTGAPPVKVPV